MLSSFDILKLNITTWNLHVADDLYDFHSETYDSEVHDFEFDKEYKEFYITRDKNNNLNVNSTQEELDNVLNYKCPHVKISNSKINSNQIESQLPVNKTEQSFKYICNDYACIRKNKKNSKFLLGLQYDSIHSWFIINSSYYYNSILKSVNTERIYSVIENNASLEILDVIKLGRARLKLEKVSFNINILN